MFCFKRNRRCSSATSFHSTPFCQVPLPSAPSYPIQQNLAQNPPSYNSGRLSCPISYYPDNLYGQGLESAVDRFDARLTDALDGTRHYNSSRDSSIPLPPGLVVVQILQPTAAPPYPISYAGPPGYSQHSQFTQQKIYPGLSGADQDYADRQMAAQRWAPSNS